VLFTTAYVASSLRALWRNELTRWLLANRRYVGLSYAVSHTLHLGAIVELARANPDFELQAVTLIVGGLAYVLLYLMTLTSNDRAVKALGLENWRRLHRTGMHYNWFIFFQSYARRAADPFYLPFFVLVVGAAMLRLTVWMRARRRASAGASSAVERADG
jgi:DMSO/TMAO reductase YedYZ heme-binding membrane subunit